MVNLGYWKRAAIFTLAGTPQRVIFTALFGALVLVFGVFGIVIYTATAIFGLPLTVVADWIFFLSIGGAVLWALWSIGCAIGEALHDAKTGDLPEWLQEDE